MNLKPCPFCGGRVVMRCNFDYEYIIFCKDCEVEVNTHYQVCDKAETAWNRRANELDQR